MKSSSGYADHEPRYPHFCWGRRTVMSDHLEALRGGSSTVVECNRRKASDKHFTYSRSHSPIDRPEPSGIDDLVSSYNPGSIAKPPLPSSNGVRTLLLGGCWVKMQLHHSWLTGRVGNVSDQFFIIGKINAVLFGDFDHAMVAGDRRQGAIGQVANHPSSLCIDFFEDF